MNHRAHLTVFCWDLNTIYIIHQAHDIVLNLVLNGLRKDHCCVPFHSWLIWHQTSCVPAISTCHKVCPVEPTLNCSSSVVTEGSALKNNSLQSCVTHYKKMALILHEKQHFVFLFFQPCADWISLSLISHSWLAGIYFCIFAVPSGSISQHTVDWMQWHYIYYINIKQQIKSLAFYSYLISKITFINITTKKYDL